MNDQMNKAPIYVIYKPWLIKNFNKSEFEG